MYPDLTHTVNSCIPISVAVEQKFPGDREKLSRMSLIEGSYYALRLLYR